MDFTIHISQIFNPIMTLYTKNVHTFKRKDYICETKMVLDKPGACFSPLCSTQNEE
ncbi:MAG: hypothetical protein ACRCX4_14610 [Bacteroidales bacterium]